MSKVYYREIGKEVLLCEHAHAAQLPLMLKGPTGCGKTRFVEYMAERLGLPLITVSCNEDTTASDLLGRHLFKGGETVWVDGPVSRAVRLGGLLYLDELAEARSDAVVVIHSLADHRRELFLDRTGETLTAPPGFLLVVSFNPGYQKSLHELKQSTRQRFIGLSFSYPAPEIETEIVAHESGIGEKLAQRLVDIARKIRALQEYSLLENASTRLLIAAGKLIARDVPPRLACFTAIAEAITDDADALAAMRKVIELGV